MFLIAVSDHFVTHTMRSYEIIAFFHKLTFHLIIGENIKKEHIIVR